MREKIVRFIGTTKALLAYMDEEYVFDRLADAGCGGSDPYRSDKFDLLIKEVRYAANELEAEISKPDMEVID